jgi:hypothetical protein
MFDTRVPLDISKIILGWELFYCQCLSLKKQGRLFEELQMQ